MNNIKRILSAFTVLTAAMFLFAACTPGSAQARQTPAGQGSDKAFEQYDEEISFEDDGSTEPAVRSKNVSRDTGAAAAAGPADESYKRDRFFQTGKASWYGREFHGKTTASGDKFNMYDMTAAHKTLPFGTIIEVTNMDSGKTVEVRVNDRGPYRGERVLDLSYNAAKNLGIVREGEGMVGIKIVQEGNGRTASREAAPDSRNIAAAGDTGRDDYAEDDGFLKDSDSPSSYSSGWSVQAGAFYSNNNASTLKGKIEDITRKKVNVVRDGDFYKVRIDGIRSRREADTIKRELRDNSIESYVLEK